MSVTYHKVGTINHYLLGAVVGKMAKLNKTCKFVQNKFKECTINHYSLDAVFRKTLRSKACHFFTIKLPHALCQYVCNISAKQLKDPMKTLGGVDFTK